MSSKKKQKNSSPLDNNQDRFKYEVAQEMGLSFRNKSAEISKKAEGKSK